MASMAEIDTPAVPVSTVYHGVTATEDYRWLDPPRWGPSNLLP